jgi:hypothetical protein
LYEDLEYSRALKRAGQSLKQPHQDPAQLVILYRIQGLCLSALGRTEQALVSFRSLLSIDPSFRLSQDVSPKLAAPFYQAVAMSREQEGILLTHTAPEAGTELAGLLFKAKLESDPLKMVKKIRFRFRTSADPKEKQMVAKVKGPRVVAMKLPARLEARQIKYYFEALNRYGAVLYRLGSSSQPMNLEAKPKMPEPRAVLAAGVSRAPESPPQAVRIPPRRHDSDEQESWYQTWWFWSAVGLAAAGLTTAVVLAADTGDSGQPVDYGVRVR